MPYNLWSENEIETLKSGITTKELVKYINRTPGAIRVKAHDLGIHLPRQPGWNRRYSINENFFKTWTSKMAYIFGFWFADGCLTKQGTTQRISFSTKDKELLEKIKITMEMDSPIGRGKDGVFILRTNNSSIAYDIKNLGGEERKSLTAIFPKIPNEFIFDFIRGYWDGDGYISKAKEKPPCTGCLGTYNFLASITKYLGEPGRFQKRGKKNTYDIRYHGEGAQQILSKLYSNASIYMDRKYKLCKRAMKWKSKIPIWSKEEIKALLNWKGSIKELSEYLGRTINSIKSKQYRLREYGYFL